LSKLMRKIEKAMASGIFQPVAWGISGWLRFVETKE